MAYDSTLVVYSSVPLTYINVTPGMNLQTILQNINTAVNTLNPVPNYATFNYGPYHGYTLTDPLGAPITTITQFVEGTANGIGKVSSDLNTFTGTTYPADQTIITNAINALTIPGLTYSYTGGGGSITITNAMTLNQVLTATYTGVGNILALLNVPGNTWSTLSIATPTDISTAFNSLIAYIANQDTIIAGKQDAIGTFDDSCLGGTATDDLDTTINNIITYTCSLPVFNAGTIIWGCVNTSADLQNGIQNIAFAITSIANSYLQNVGTGLTSTAAILPCNGYTVAIDTTWAGLYKAAVSGTDTTPSNLVNKISAGNGITINTLNAGANEQLEIAVTNVPDYKTMVNLSDATPGYLADKLPSTLGAWGLGIQATPTSDYSQLQLIPTVNDPALFVQSLLTYISSDPTTLALFCSIQTQCAGCICTAPSNLTVTLATNIFDLSWTVGGTPVSQMVKYRERGYVDWISNANITAPNPQTNAATTASVDLSTCPNTVYQFQVDSICSGTSNGSNIYESIFYNCQTLSANVIGGVITVTQSALPTISVIEYTLYDALSTPIETVSATGLNPIAKFASVGAGTYTVEWRYGTLVNGVMLYSNDPSQLNATCVSGSIVVS